MAKKHKKAAMLSFSKELIESFLQMEHCRIIDIKYDFYRECLLIKIEEISSLCDSDIPTINGKPVKLYTMVEGQEYMSISLP